MNLHLNVQQTQPVYPSELGIGPHEPTQLELLGAVIGVGYADAKARLVALGLSVHLRTPVEIDVLNVEFGGMEQFAPGWYYMRPRHGNGLVYRVTADS